MVCFVKGARGLPTGLATSPIGRKIEGSIPPKEDK
jgi:hypothetical protein